MITFQALILPLCFCFDSSRALDPFISLSFYIFYLIVINRFFSWND